jgi:hypothetical protein
VRYGRSGLSEGQRVKRCGLASLVGPDQTDQIGIQAQLVRLASTEAPQAVDVRVDEPHPHIMNGRPDVIARAASGELDD